jgi:GNAT superfamily N-acetyltransferase
MPPRPPHPSTDTPGTRTMTRFTLGLTLLSAASPALLLRADDPCRSGVPVGKRPGPYSFLVATGPQRGQQTCYICEQHEGNKPAAVVFARTLSDPLARLLSRLEALGTSPAARGTGYKVWCTVLVDTADLDALARWAQTQGLKTVPLGAYEDTDGPPAYKLHKDADVTVLLFTKQKVVANFAFRAGELTDQQIDAVLQAAPLLFPKK